MSLLDSYQMQVIKQKLLYAAPTAVYLCTIFHLEEKTCSIFKNEIQPVVHL